MIQLAGNTGLTIVKTTKKGVVMGKETFDPADI
jgi:hypothetical protein